MKRRDFLQASAALPAVVVADRLSVSAAGASVQEQDQISQAAQSRADLAGMNVVVFITDQQRAITHFPEGWSEANLPAATQLQQTGVTFENAFCNACMCSPSRASLLTGLLPAQHGVKYTLEENMPNDEYPQVPLPLDLANIGSVMGAAGFQTPYKGKWHVSKPAGSEWTTDDLAQYGFQRWDAPDAGANQDLDQMGGGVADHDGRFMEDDGPVEEGREGVLEFLTSDAAQQQPFFLIVSLVNPHDVLTYPKNYIEGGYDDSALVGDIDLPPTIDESLATKPTAQKAILQLANQGLGQLTTPEEQRNYLNFYGNLMKESDAYLMDILNVLTSQGLLENTLVVATSDHGGAV